MTVPYPEAEFPIVEFETAPEVAGHTDSGGWTFKWEAKISVDLTWVSSARPMEWQKATAITMAGGAPAFTINIPYPDFMVLWTKARAQKP